MEIAGTYLWLVELSGSSVNLWVTTRRKSISTATAKAVRFLKRNRDEFRHAEITSINSRGTLDA